MSDISLNRCADFFALSGLSVATAYLCVMFGWLFNLDLTETGAVFTVSLWLMWAATSFSIMGMAIGLIKFATAVYDRYRA